MYKSENEYEILPTRLVTRETRYNGKRIQQNESEVRIVDRNLEGMPKESHNYEGKLQDKT